jgi:hypothetical protein
MKKSESWVMNKDVGCPNVIFTSTKRATVNNLWRKYDIFSGPGGLDSINVVGLFWSSRDWNSNGTHYGSLGDGRAHFVVSLCHCQQDRYVKCSQFEGCPLAVGKTCTGPVCDARYLKIDGVTERSDENVWTELCEETSSRFPCQRITCCSQTRKFIAVSTKANHWSLSTVNLIQFETSHRTFINVSFQVLMAECLNMIDLLWDYTAQ